MGDTLGVLLAGGRGSRFGGERPKALAAFRGDTLLGHALGLLRAVCREVVVCAPRGMSLPVGDDLRVEDPPGDAGPLAAMVAGLRSRPCSSALVLAVDLPLLTPRLLAAMGGLLPGERAVVPSPGDRPQPLAAWYAPGAAGLLAEALARGERSIVRAVRSLEPRLLCDPELAALGARERSFLNVNTEGDMAEAASVAELWERN